MSVMAVVMGFIMGTVAVVMGFICLALTETLSMMSSPHTTRETKLGLSRNHAQADTNGKGRHDRLAAPCSSFLCKSINIRRE